MGLRRRLTGRASPTRREPPGTAGPGYVNPPGGAGRKATRRLLRAGIVFLFVFGLLTIMGSPAVAVLPDIPHPHVDLNPLDNIVNKLCPTKDSPNPEMPEPGLPKGPGDYEKFGYAGLTWTTYDQSCLSVAKLDNGMGNALNDVATGIDGLVNQAQGKALDPH